MGAGAGGWSRGVGWEFLEEGKKGAKLGQMESRSGWGYRGNSIVAGVKHGGESEGRKWVGKVGYLVKNVSA